VKKQIEIQRWFPLKYDGKNVGEILLEVTYLSEYKSEEKQFASEFSSQQKSRMEDEEGRAIPLGGSESSQQKFQQL